MAVSGYSAINVQGVGQIILDNFQEYGGTNPSTWTAQTIRASNCLFGAGINYASVYRSVFTNCDFSIVDNGTGFIYPFVVAGLNAISFFIGCIINLPFSLEEGGTPYVFYITNSFIASTSINSNMNYIFQLASGSSSAGIGYLAIKGCASFGGSTGTLFASGIGVTESDIEPIEGSSTVYSSIKPAPTTPTVPASGATQQNTNRYRVNVYLNGGTVTEIQITRNGTFFPVFSSSTGIALTGQAYELNPLDYIIITYTTAPTWTWLRN